MFDDARSPFWTQARVVPLDAGKIGRGLVTIIVSSSEPCDVDLQLTFGDEAAPMRVQLDAEAQGRYARTLSLARRAHTAELLVSPPGASSDITITIDRRSLHDLTRLAWRAALRHASKPGLLIAKARQLLSGHANAALTSTMPRGVEDDRYRRWQSAFESATEHARWRAELLRLSAGESARITVVATAQELAALTSRLDNQPPHLRPAVAWRTVSCLDGQPVDVSHLLGPDASILIVSDEPCALSRHALEAVALGFALAPGATVLYGDHDSLSEPDRRRHAPVHKPCWSPDYHAAIGYAGPVYAVRSTEDALSSLVGLAAGDGLGCRWIERLVLAGHRVTHVPVILSHRTRPGTGAPRVQELEPLVRSRNEPPTVSALIPSKNNPDQLRAACRSVLAATGVSADVIIIDNGATARDQRAALDDLAGDPRVHVLSCPGPFNFSALVNAGRRLSSADALLLMNDDVESLDDAWLAAMTHDALRDDVGAVGAVLLYPDGRVQHAGVVLGAAGVAAHVLRFWDASNPDPMGRLTAKREVAAVTGACLTVRADRFDEVGGFAEDLPVTFNDIDFCLRLSARGYRNLVTPAARLIHHESVSRGLDADADRLARLDRETAAFERRWRTLNGHDPWFSPHLMLTEAGEEPRRL